MNKELILLRSVSGAGKSTLAKLLMDCGAVQQHIEADMYFTSGNGEYQFDPSKLSIAHQWCKSVTEDFMQSGISLVVSNTFTTEKELKPYLDLAEKYNYKVTSLVVENRHGGVDIHGVPDEIKQRQASRLQQSIKLF
jgi:predicted kinase